MQIGKSLSIGAAAMLTAMVAPATTEAQSPRYSFGRVQISTLPFDPHLVVRSATYIPSGKVLVSYADKVSDDPRIVKLAVIDDDGKNMRPFFAQRLPDREKDNGIRFMVFPDNKRIFLGDFIIECATSIDDCTAPALYPVQYPAEVASGDHIAHRWSEMIVAPDNQHVSWTTLLSNFAAVVFVGALQKTDDGYKIVQSQIISTLDPFKKDPKHPDGVLPQTVRGGEVKQFIHGGSAISLAGAISRDTPDSVVQYLGSGRMEAITDTPGYTETTIFSPDERLGITMTTRFSKRTDPAILGLMPRPYPASLNMGLSMFAYTYSVTGVRRERIGSIGPALIDVQASKAGGEYAGANLNTQEEWVYRSPMSWHPSSKKAMWTEGRRSDGAERIQIVHLPDYRPQAAVPAKGLPSTISYGLSDLSLVRKQAQTSRNIDVKIYGRKSGYIHYRRTPAGLTEKIYVDFSDDGQAVYTGEERLQANPQGRSIYSAKLRLSGPRPGTMDLQITFGPLGGAMPAKLLFEPDASGIPMTHGYVEYGGKRLTVEALLP
ncbi:hypothetical protein MOK15_10765 [Sphingobium sp. BYY-5]|uniref:hypothetical protein n=1 Tax=Sphingobium sp. BYY-5 TaxID=2926400 RepID=UPI001FA6F38F|nr:hypothetical protein [Sphingobium sp. BYY-5]MCI4590575.1 hypothetical protein [Sphingobium sp. BYY-5]